MVLDTSRLGGGVTGELIGNPFLHQVLAYEKTTRKARRSRERNSFHTIDVRPIVGGNLGATCDAVFQPSRQRLVIDVHG